MPFTRLIIILLALGFSWAAFADSEEEILPPDQAFKISAQALSPKRIEIRWDITEGYYLYQSKLHFTSKSPDIALGGPELPDGIVKHDEFFGDVVTYRNALAVPIALTLHNQPGHLALEVKYQGCADIGICYPPQKTVLDIDLPQAPANDVISQLLSGKNSAGDQELLPAEQAFQFSATIKDGQTLNVDWQLAPGYYLYRDKIQLSLVNTDNTSLGTYTIPRGTPSHDEEFGDVEIFHGGLNFELPLIRNKTGAQSITLLAHYQGCADRGVCYPPMSKQIKLELPAISALTPADSSSDNQSGSEQDQIAASLKQDSLWLTLASFFGFGVLLSLTPCIFPMLPILSGIIVGHDHINAYRGFLLSLSYVTASAAMYTVFGVLAAVFGSNLQATFQQPWIIALFSAIFVILALSMFGFYHLEVPKWLQAKLHNSSERHRDGSLWGAAIMGALSSLIVGPCVAAPLAGALIYIGQTGNALLGGSALFVMGMGMGLPLLVLGASAGKWLPKSGAWLNAVKAVFGVLMLAVAVWMLQRILPPAVSMLLWAMLLVIPAIYLSALDPLPHESSGWRKLWKGIGMIMLAYGLMLLAGLGLGNSNPLKPLAGLGLQTAVGADEKAIAFTGIASVTELENRIHQAGTQGQWVMLDYYADWCISCKEMEAYTLTDPKVKAALSQFVLLRADVTENNANDTALLDKFSLIGPPAILFFAPNGEETLKFRVIGYQDAETFLKTLGKLKP
ncbi:MAG: thiol:disulfide interchange protein [Methylobacter sp.]|nr:MAG: thiol:disulfide interchange protein [Methylobacter sp.]